MVLPAHLESNDPVDVLNVPVSVVAVSASHESVVSPEQPRVGSVGLLGSSVPLAAHDQILERLCHSIVSTLDPASRVSSQLDQALILSVFVVEFELEMSCSAADEALLRTVRAHSEVLRA